MSRRLILLRHAKSDRPPGVPDRDRPLAARGRADAPRIAAYMAAQGLRPDHALISPARRTVETWEAVRPVLGGPEGEQVVALYEADAERIARAVRGAPAAARCLVVVGHNPGLQDCAVDLVGSGDRDALTRLATQFSTAALAVIDFDIEGWDGLAFRRGRLDRFVRPGDLDG